MDDSPLGKLPRELRDQIFDLAMTCDRGVQFDVFREDQSSHQPQYAVRLANAKNTRKIISGISATCRQARSETCGLFWSCNTFVLDLRRYDHYLDGRSRPAIDLDPVDDRVKVYTETMIKLAALVGKTAVTQMKRVTAKFSSYCMKEDWMGELAALWSGVAKVSTDWHKTAETVAIVHVSSRVEPGRCTWEVRARIDHAESLDSGCDVQHSAAGSCAGRGRRF